MANSKRVRGADLRAVSGLLDECRQRGDAAGAWREHFARGLGQLTGAAATTVQDGCWQPYRPNGIVLWGTNNGFDTEVIGEIYAAFAREGVAIVPMFKPFVTALAQGRGNSFSREQLVDDAEWFRSRYVQHYHTPSRSGAMMYSSFDLPGAPGQMSGITLMRLCGERSFSAREQAIVEAAHAQVAAWTGGLLAPFAEPSPAALTLRCRTVLACLLEGDSDKQIALRLDLSRFTVNEYVKEIFRHFRVTTRSELLARWVCRGWADEPLDGDPAFATLPAPLREVLQCVLEGDADKQIVHRLRLSPTAVHEALRKLRRHFGVKHRNELLALWIEKRWQKPFHWL